MQPTDGSVDRSGSEAAIRPDVRASTGHEKHCFVVMPSGREPSEHKWFKGWYEVVIKPGVIEAGYEPILAAAEEQPGAINDEIRAHLALDPMVVVDLAGAEPEDDPNPNVMYELGIRHALGLPLVMTAWKGQRLPFDVSNQRVIMEDRDLVDLETNRKRLVSFVRAAEQGKYYRPMEAVSRLATIAAASESLGEDSLLRALALEIRDLRSTVVAGMSAQGHRRTAPHQQTIKRILRGKVFRKDLYPHFIANGGTPGAWARLLKTPLPLDSVDQYASWGRDEWKDYVASLAKQTTAMSPVADPPTVVVAVAPTKAKYEDEDLLSRVRPLLPTQPWPTGIHREIAARLGIPPHLAWECIAELIRRAEFMPQSGGQIVPSTPDGG